MIDRK